jgi:hypothetical protein
VNIDGVCRLNAEGMDHEPETVTKYQTIEDAAAPSGGMMPALDGLIGNLKAAFNLGPVLS